MMRHMNLITRCCLGLVYLLLMLSSPANACEWDSDTLKQEAGQVPQVVDVITGRFPRNPNLYYEMRLDRVREILAAHPDRLELYDDAGVACDRLNRGKEAIAWMRRKRIYLQRSSQSPSTHDQWYRYHANLGTFLVHDWFRQGADRHSIEQVRRARNEIAEAIHLNPNAHFGREKYQLMAMDWIINPRSRSFADFLDARGESNYAATIRGLTGLIVMGNAWRSVDIFEALATTLINRMENSLGYLALLRASELVDEGARPLLAGKTTAADLKAKLLDRNDVMIHEDQKAEVKEQYLQLRANADSWEESRTAFMMIRLRQGRHPDTDASFWKGYREVDRVDLDHSRLKIEIIVPAAGVVSVIVFWFISRRRRTRFLARQRSGRPHENPI